MIYHSVIIHEKIVSGLIGLVGAVGNEGKSETTIPVIQKALRYAIETKTTRYTDLELEEVYQEVEAEKRKLAPGCSSCKAQCGNTSDFDMRQFFVEEDAVNQAKVKLLVYLNKLAEKATEMEEQLLFQAVAYLGYHLGAEHYEELIHKLELYME